MRDTDAAGVIFFSNQLHLAHEAFEDYLDSVGLGIGVILGSRDYRIPIVHADADYRLPLKAGDAITVNMVVERIGNSSFTLRFSILNADGREAGSARTVQAAVDAATWRSRPLPDELRKALETHRA